jgi:hypothetical protein
MDVEVLPVIDIEMATLVEADSLMLRLSFQAEGHPPGTAGGWIQWMLLGPAQLTELERQIAAGRLALQSGAAQSAGDARH